MENVNNFVVRQRGIIDAPDTLLIALDGSHNFGPSIASIKVESPNTERISCPTMKGT